MRNAAFTLALLALVAGTSEAQVRGRVNNGQSQGIPPGQMPRAGQCRVWYDGVPPGRQPAPTNCDQAERIASRDRNARVIYGDDRYARNDDWRYRDRTGNVYPNGNRYPDSNTYPNGNTYPNNGRGYGYNTVPYDNGYRDGVEKGREDGRRNNSYDPVRHSRYRAGDNGYNNRYGTRDSYKMVYRDGFESGYDQGYREVKSYGANRRY